MAAPSPTLRMKYTNTPQAYFVPPDQCPLNKRKTSARITPMKNVEMTVEGSVLTVKVDLSKQFGPSASGKSVIIATTEGNVIVPDYPDESLRIGLNVYKLKLPD